jgi:hypothetical protein
VFTWYKVQVPVLNRHKFWEGWTQIRTLMVQTESISESAGVFEKPDETARENLTEHY